MDSLHLALSVHTQSFYDFYKIICIHQWSRLQDPTELHQHDSQSTYKHLIDISLRKAAFF